MFKQQKTVMTMLVIGLVIGVGMVYEVVGSTIATASSFGAIMLAVFVTTAIMLFAIAFVFATVFTGALSWQLLKTQ